MRLSQDGSPHSVRSEHSPSQDGLCPPSALDAKTWRCKSLDHKGLQVVSLSNRNSCNILPSGASLVYGLMTSQAQAAGGGRQVMRNKANDGPEALGIAECGLRIEEQETVTAGLRRQARETKPICPAGQMVCTAHPTERRRARFVKQSQFPGPGPLPVEDVTRETKPIGIKAEDDNYSQEEEL